MRILLLNICPGFSVTSSEKEITGSSFYPPLGLLYIGQSLIEQGHQVEIIDFLSEKNPEETLRKDLSSYDAVGISTYSLAYEKAAKVARDIKNIDPNIPIILGGPHCIYLSKKALNDIPAADMCIEGEAERSINDLIQALQGKKHLAEVAGIHYRENGIIKTGKPPDVIEDLNSIGFPARHLVDKYEYGKVNKTFFYKPRFTCILTSRGCPFQCRFCTRHITSMKNFRKRSVENVIQELQEINEEYSSVMIADDNFLADKKHAYNILEQIIDLGIDLEFYIQGARVDSADRTLYEKMKKAGVKHLYFGIESGNQDILDYYNKNITLDQVRKAVNLSNEIGFFTRGSFIIGAPFETKEHIEQTIKFACSLPLDLAVFNILSYQRGSDLWNEAYNSGKITDDDKGFHVLADSRSGLGNFTEEELEKYCSIAFKKFYGRPTFIARQIIKAFRLKDFKIIRVGLNYF